MDANVSEGVRLINVFFAVPRPTFAKRNRKKCTTTRHTRIGLELTNEERHAPVFSSKEREKEREKKKANTAVIIASLFLHLFKYSARRAVEGSGLIKILIS